MSQRPQTYRKVWLFGMFALVDLALAALDKVGGDAALTALGTAYAAAVGLNVWEHVQSGKRAPTAPTRPAERQEVDADTLVGAADALRLLADEFARKQAARRVNP